MRLAACLVWLVACGSSALQMKGTQDSPAAEGSVKVGSTSNDNTQLVLEVKHMAQPERVRPDAHAYVVWARPLGESGTTQSLGSIKIDSDLAGRLETVTALKVFDLFITAEPSAMAQAPTGQMVLSVRVNRD